MLKAATAWSNRLASSGVAPLSGLPCASAVMTFDSIPVKLKLSPPWRRSGRPWAMGDGDISRCRPAGNARCAGTLDRSAALRGRNRPLDALLDMLRAMRLTGGIFLDAQFSAPWSVLAQVAPEDCAPFTAAPRQIIAYHYVTAGRCLLTVGDRQPIEVRSGEIVVMPRNARHVVASAAQLCPVNIDHLIEPAPEGGPARIVHGGGGETTSILCGFLGNDLAHNALIALLPDVLKLDAADGASGDWIKGTFQFAARELAGGQTHSPAILARLAELLFMEAVRRYFAAQPPAASAWAAGMRDPLIGRALGLLHGQLARRWTTGALADELAVSRSA